jgi:hypothetical protein
MAFENLKQALTNTPILAYPRNEDSFILDTDASNTCMTSFTFLGTGHSETALVFSGSVDTPSSLTTCPKYVTRFWKNLHFLEFNFKDRPFKVERHMDEQHSNFGYMCTECRRVFCEETASIKIVQWGNKAERT